MQTRQEIKACKGSDTVAPEFEAASIIINDGDVVASEDATLSLTLSSAPKEYRS